MCTSRLQTFDMKLSNGLAHGYAPSVRQETAQLLQGNLPEFCLQAEPPRPRCSAALEASASGLHSRDDPSYCRLPTRDNNGLKNRSPYNFYIHPSVYFLFMNQIYIYKRKESSLGSHLAPQCWFSSQRSKHMQGSGHSVLNWWQCDWVKQEAKEETQRFLCPCDSDNPIRVLYVALQGGNHNLKSPPFWAATTTVLCHFITTWNTRVTHRTQ